MKGFVLRVIGFIFQIATMFNLIRLFELEEYGKYIVVIYEVNLISLLLSFGVINFNLNNIVEKKENLFNENNAKIIFFSCIGILLLSILFIFKYNILLVLLISVLAFFKVLQNISYCGILGEKGVNEYNLFLNIQLITFFFCTLIPGVSLEVLLICWIVLTVVNLIFLRKYIINAFNVIKVYKIKDLNSLLGKSIYDFTNNFGNRFELIILSTFTNNSLVIGVLSVFMQVGDSLVNFFKALAPKIQLLTLNSNKSLKKVHALVFVVSLAIVIFLNLTYDYWVGILKPELMVEKSNFYIWSIVILLSVLVWASRFEMQGFAFNLKKYNFYHVIVLIISSVLVVLFSYDITFIIFIHIIYLISIFVITKLIIKFFYRIEK